ncbi:hypothetical protein D3C72_1382800 [compost metagenome]
MDPFPQPALERSVPEFERPRRKCCAFANGHDPRLIRGDGGDDGDEFGMGKPDGHGGSSGRWL